MAARARRASHGPRSGSGHLHHAEGLAVKHWHRQRPALQEALDQCLVVQSKRAVQRAFQLHLVAHQGAPEKQRSAHRPHDHGEPESTVNFADAVLLLSPNHVGRRRGQVVQAQDVLCFRAVHGQARGQYARTGVRDGEHLQQALQAAIRAISAAHSHESQVYPRLA